ASYVTGTLTVNAKAAVVTANNQAKTYGGADPAFTFQVTGLEASDSLSGVSCGVSGAHSNAGTYSIGCAGNTNGNYTASYVAGTLTVHAKAAVVTADNQAKTYGGADPAFTFQVTGLAASDSLSGVSCGVSGAHSNAGSYSIVCAGNTNGNYTASYVAGTLTVKAKAAGVTAENQAKTYGGADPAFTFQVTGLEASDSLSGVSCGVSGAHNNAGTYSIVCAGNTNSNYTASYTPGTLTVNAKAAVVTADNQAKTYGGADPAVTSRVAGPDAGDSLSDVICAVTGAST